MTSGTARIYYEDQRAWSPSDYYALWRYFDRLAEYVGPTPAQASEPERRSARIQARRTSVRDEELTAIDVSRMPSESAVLFKAVLMSQQRYELALERFPNLDALQEIEPPSQYRGPVGRAGTALRQRAPRSCAGCGEEQHLPAPRGLPCAAPTVCHQPALLELAGSYTAAQRHRPPHLPRVPEAVAAQLKNRGDQREISFDEFEAAAARLSLGSSRR